MFIFFSELCWWINGVIMPELHVYRGETYYFKVFTVGNKCHLQYKCCIFYRVPQNLGELSEDLQNIWNLTNICL